MVAGASEVRLPGRGWNPVAVACGDCLRMAVDVLPSGKLGREFLDGNAGRKELPFLAGADRCRRNGMLLVAVLRDGIRKRKTRKGGNPCSRNWHTGCITFGARTAGRIKTGRSYRMPCG